MNGTTVAVELEKIQFAKDAAAWFSKNKQGQSYGDIKKGGYLALRWGLGEDCVLVLRQCNYFEPVRYDQIIEKGGS